MSSKNAKLWAEKSPFWVQFKDNVDILSAPNLPCQKFVALVRKLQLSSSPRPCWMSVHWCMHW